MAKHLAGSHAKVDQVLASPLVRAQETAVIMASVVTPNYPPSTFKQLGTATTPALLYNALIPLLTGPDLLLVGHEPTLSMFTSMLISGKEHGHIHFTQAAIAAIEVVNIDGRLRGTLHWLISPEII